MRKIRALSRGHKSCNYRVTGRALVSFVFRPRPVVGFVFAPFSIFRKVVVVGEEPDLAFVRLSTSPMASYGVAE